MAAVTAITPQPNAAVCDVEHWMTVLQTSAPRFAYEAVRWSKSTWCDSSWAKLRDRLRNAATRDFGRYFYLWHRDIAPSECDAALRNERIQVLWAAELVNTTCNYGQALRRLCAFRLKADSTDAAAKLALRWLSSRNAPR